MLVPNRINSLFAKSYAIRDNLPIGVTYYWYDNSRYLASMKIDNRKHIKLEFLIIQWVRLKRTRKKEKYIKEVADSYKSVIPIKVYDAMYQYEILITD